MSTLSFSKRLCRLVNDAVVYVNATQSHISDRIRLRDSLRDTYQHVKTCTKKKMSHGANTHALFPTGTFLRGLQDWKLSDGDLKLLDHGPNVSSL